MRVTRQTGGSRPLAPSSSQGWQRARVTGIGERTDSWTEGQPGSTVQPSSSAPMSCLLRAWFRWSLVFHQFLHTPKPGLNNSNYNL